MVYNHQSSAVWGSPHWICAAMQPVQRNQALWIWQVVSSWERNLLFLLSALTNDQSKLSWTGLFLCTFCVLMNDILRQIYFPTPVDPCKSNPCLSNGSCFFNTAALMTEIMYYCLCGDTFTGTHCETRESMKLLSSNALEFRRFQYIMFCQRINWGHQTGRDWDAIYCLCVLWEQVNCTAFKVPCQGGGGILKTGPDSMCENYKQWKHCALDNIWAPRTQPSKWSWPTGVWW